MADPRMKFVPELEEERFQSMVAVPILAKSGDVIGVVVLHTAAPRGFDDDVLNFLVHTASLVAGAIENAQLYEETRRRVQALTTLTAAEPGARRGHPARGPLRSRHPRRPRAAAAPTRARSTASTSRPTSWSWPAPTRRTQRPRARARRAPSLVLDLMRRANGGRGRGGGASGRRRPLAGDRRERAAGRRRCWRGDEQLGIICCLASERQFGDEDAELLGAVANQTAVGLKKAELIERLTAENLVKDMFDALAAGSVDAARGEGERGALRPRASRTSSCTSSGRREAPTDGRVWPELAGRLEAQLRRLYPRAFFDSRHDRVRALAPLRPSNDGAVEELRAACESLGREDGLVVGLSDVDRGAASARRRMREAADAARIGRSLVAEGGAVSYEQLGAYRYLVHLELDEAPRDRYRQSVEKLLEYDRRRGTRLVETLEQFLADRGSVTASARALYVHPNTVRQRLERIERVAELDLPDEDLLSLELALKLARLHRVRAETE